MKNRALMGLVVAVGVLMSSVAWGKLLDQSDFITPNKTLPPWTWPLTSECGASPFSQKVEDYMLSIQPHPTQKSFWQLSFYGRLLPAIDPAKLPSIGTNVDVATIADESTKVFLFMHMIDPFVGIFPVLIIPSIGHCEVLPNKDVSTKGALFRCNHLLPVEGVEIDVVKSDTSIKYNITDGALDSASKVCVRVPSTLTFKQMVEQAGADADADGVPDSIDNCPSVANFSQDVDAGGKPVACPEAAACDAATVCTEEACANNGFGGSCDVGTVCTADVCAGLGLSTGTDGGSGVNEDGGGMCALIPVGAANPAGFLLLLSAVGFLAARRRR